MVNGFIGYRVRGLGFGLVFRLAMGFMVLSFFADATRRSSDIPRFISFIMRKHTMAPVHSGAIVCFIWTPR